MTAKRNALTLTALLLASPVSAQPTASQTAKVTALWESALDEWAPLFTCGATIALSDDFLRNFWSKTREEALDAMRAANWPTADLDKWQAKSDPDAMRLADNTPFAEVIAYCAERKDWVERSNHVDVPFIGAEVKKALNAEATP